MSLKYKRVAVIGKYQDASRLDTAERGRLFIEELLSFLQALGCEVMMDRRTARSSRCGNSTVLPLNELGKQSDVCIVAGGDGTMLGIGRELAQHGTPLIGINQGRLGFITDIAQNDYQNVLPDMLLGAVREDRRALMVGNILRGDHCLIEALAMNDVVVNRGSTSGMIEMRVEVDGRFVANYRADGMIVATPTGSTAYSLSAGGPLLHPQLPGLALVPISPHTLSNRPIVLAAPSEIAITFVAGRRASANFDMQSRTGLEHGDQIIIRRSSQEVCFLHPEDWNYFDTLRGKLHWNHGSD